MNPHCPVLDAEALLHNGSACVVEVAPELTDYLHVKKFARAGRPGTDFDETASMHPREDASFVRSSRRRSRLSSCLALVRPLRCTTG